MWGYQGAERSRKTSKNTLRKIERGEKPLIQRRENRDLYMKLQRLKDALEEKTSPFWRYFGVMMHEMN